MAISDYDFIDENSTDHKRLFRANKQLLAKKEEFSCPNYQDKSKLANDIGGFFVRKIDRIRFDIDAVDIDPSARNELPPDQEVDAAHAFHSFQPLSEYDVSASDADFSGCWLPWRAVACYFTNYKSFAIMQPFLWGMETTSGYSDP